MPARDVRIEQPPEVRRRDQVAVEQEDRIGRRFAQQAQRAGRPERLLLAQVVDGRAEPAAVAEVILDEVAQVVHRHRDPLDPEADAVQDESLDDRASGDREHRLGQVLGQRSQPHAAAAGHDHGPVRARDRLEELLEEMEADRPAVAVDDGDRVDPARAHELEHGRAVVLRPDRQEGPRQHGLDRIRQGDAAQQRAAEVAVGHDPGQPTLAVDREGDPARAPVDGGHRLAHGGAGGDEIRVERRTHRSGGDAQHAAPARHRVDDDGAHPDERPGTDLDVVADARPETDERARPDPSPAPDGRPGAEMAADPELDVVLDDRARVDDRMRPDGGTELTTARARIATPGATVAEGETQAAAWTTVAQRAVGP